MYTYNIYYIFRYICNIFICTFTHNFGNVLKWSYVVHTLTNKHYMLLMAVNMRSSYVCTISYNPFSRQSSYFYPCFILGTLIAACVAVVMTIWNCCSCLLVLSLSHGCSWFYSTFGSHFVHYCLLLWIYAFQWRQRLCSRYTECRELVRDISSPKCNGHSNWFISMYIIQPWIKNHFKLMIYFTLVKLSKSLSIIFYWLIMIHSHEV